MALPFFQRWLLVMGFVLPAAAARAQDGAFELGAPPVAPTPPPLFTSYAEAGVGHLDSDSAHFGRYGGPTDRGPFPVFRGLFDGGDRWDSGGTRFWSGALEVFGRDAIAGSLRFGEQGRWRVGAFYDGFVRSYTGAARSPFNGIGSTTPTLPLNWVSSNSSLQFASLTQNLKPLDLEVAWRTVGGDLVAHPRQGYEIRLSASHRDREGLRGQNLAFGHEMNSAVGVFFPQPVDYETDRVSAALAFTGDGLQWSASYNLSVFTNAVASVRVPNPYNRALIGNWPGGALVAFPNGFGEYGLPPSSTAHQALFSVAYAVSPKVRVTTRATYTVQTQDEDFLPYTTLSGLSVSERLPRASLDGAVHKANVALAATLRPTSAIDVGIYYTFDDRDNRSPMDIYNYVANDSQDQPRPLIPGASRYVRINLPHSFTFHQAKADVNVRIAPRTRLTLTYVGDFRARKYQQVSDTSEHGLRAKALTTFSAGSAWLAYAYSTRNGSAYEDALPWDLSHTQSYLDASPFNRSIEHPLLRKYNMANRERHEARAGVSWEFGETVIFDATTFLAEDDYKDSPLGLQRAETVQLDGNLTYLVGKSLTATGFYSFERIKFDLTGYLMGTINLANPAQNWSSASRDLIHTTGVKVDWAAMADMLKLGAAYYLSDGTGRISTLGTTFALVMSTAPLPDIRDVTRTVNLTGEYKLRPDTTLRLGYTWQRHRTIDWQFGGSASPVAQVLGSGVVPPRYTAHLVWVTARYAF